MYVSQDQDNVVVRKVKKITGPNQVQACLQVIDRNGHVLQEMEDACPHISPCLAELRHFGTGNYVAHACLMCKIIHVYNMDQKSFYDAFPWGLSICDVTDESVIAEYVAGDFLICTGPIGTLFASRGTNAPVIQLQWQESNMELVESHKLPELVSSGQGMCYVEQSDVLITTQSNGSVIAFKPTTNQMVWQLPEIILG